MIKIISGVYGYLDKNGCVKPKTEKDGSFSLSEEQEARLVGLGVAEYVNTQDTVKEPETEPDGAEKPLEEMTAKELREIGKEMGYSFKVGLTKAEMIECIKHGPPDAAAPEDTDEDTEDDGDDDGETMPNFDPSEAVQ